MAEARTRKISAVAGKKLRTYEPRMFDERVFYLNKSTTKYIIIGIDRQIFTSHLRICDRVTGTFITIQMEKFKNFILHLKNEISGMYAGFVEDGYSFCGIHIAQVGFSDTWKLYSVNKRPEILFMRRDSLEKIISFESIISREMLQHDGVYYRDTVASLREETGDLTESELFDHLIAECGKEEYGSKRYHVLRDLVCCRESLMSDLTFKWFFVPMPDTIPMPERLKNILYKKGFVF